MDNDGFRDHYENGMDYLGYYLDERGHYHFIFYELVNEKLCL